MKMQEAKQEYRLNSTFNPGYIEAITGTMFSGKTREILQRGRKAERHGSVKVQYFKPSVDKRNNELLVSRDGEKQTATTFQHSSELLDLINGEGRLVLIDEAQFSDKALAYVVQLLKEKGHNIVLAGLSKDYRAQPFGVMADIMALSDLEIKQVYSVCSVEKCHNDGTLSQRLREGSPDSALSPTVIIEGSDEEVTYQPRCEVHHVVPDLKEYLEKMLSKEKARVNTSSTS